MQHGCSVRPVTAARSAGKGKAKKGQVELMARKHHAHDCATYADCPGTIRVIRAPHGGRDGRDKVWKRALKARSEVRHATGVQTIVAGQGAWVADRRRQAAESTINAYLG